MWSNLFPEGLLLVPQSLNKIIITKFQGKDTFVSKQKYLEVLSKILIITINKQIIIITINNTLSICNNNHTT